MMGQKPVLVMFEKRNALHHQIEEQKGESEDGGRGGLHVEAGEQEGESQDRSGIDCCENVREQVEPEAFPRGQDTERRPW